MPGWTAAGELPAAIKAAYCRPRLSHNDKVAVECPLLLSIGSSYSMLFA